MHQRMYVLHLIKERKNQSLHFFSNALKMNNFEGKIAFLSIHFYRKPMSFFDFTDKNTLQQRKLTQ